MSEANAIGTACLRLELLTADAQSAMRSKFRAYIESRYNLWRLVPDREAALAEFARSERLQQEIWEGAIAATEGETGGDARKLLLPALNEMIDITTSRLIAVQAHPPFIIFLLLGMLSLAAAWNIGYGMSGSARASLPHLIGFALMVTVAVGVILDIEYLRYGLVTLDEPHELLRELALRLH